MFFGTFLLEDVALATALALIANEKIGLLPAFLACFFGIGIGDLALYLIGIAMGRLGMADRFRSVRKFRASLVDDKGSNFLTNSIVLSRFIPGTRLPTYLVAGLIGYPFWRFFILTLVTVSLWVILVFAFGQAIKTVLLNHWILTVAAILLFLKVIKSLVPKLSDYWSRKALLHSWRQLLSFEFWPAIFFYLPIIPYVAYLGIKYRSLLVPFYANPEIENGGLIGESKWDFLKHLQATSPHTLKAFKMNPQKDFSKARELIDKEGFNYPFILKPDVGQRGFGVRIIRSDFDLTEYLRLADFEMIVQKLSRLPGEAGIFYIRHPSAQNGSLFSITEKKFPTVIGDGQSKLGDLILSDPRARIIAATYFSRHRHFLGSIPKSGEVFQLAECGNHCQGAIFLNGEKLKTPELLFSIEAIARKIPHFYFGRLDIRYQDASSLMNGANFEIVEINGAGSEATHIWDESTTLRQAHRTLFAQWRLLFEIGQEVKLSATIKSNVHPLRFLKESAKVVFRKETLSVSS